MYNYQVVLTKSTISGWYKVKLSGFSPSLSELYTTFLQYGEKGEVCNFFKYSVWYALANWVNDVFKQLLWTLPIYHWSEQTDDRTCIPMAEPMLQCHFLLWCSNKQNNVLIVPQFLSHFLAELSFGWITYSIVVNPH